MFTYYLNTQNLSFPPAVVIFRLSAVPSTEVFFVVRVPSRFLVEVPKRNNEALC